MRKKETLIKEKLLAYRLKKDLDFLEEDKCYYDLMYVLYSNLSNVVKIGRYQIKYVISTLLLALLLYSIYILFNLNIFLVAGNILLGMHLGTLLIYLKNLMMVKVYEEIISHFE